jgi:hypothetical protein
VATALVGATALCSLSRETAGAAGGAPRSQVVATLPTGTVRVGAGHLPVLRVGGFELPSGAKQGKGGRWYVGTVALRIDVRALDGRIPAHVSLETNRRAFIQVELRRIGRGDDVAWSAYGLLDGVARGVGHHGHVSARLRNFLQDDGVRPGRNSFEVAVQQFGVTRIRAVRVDRTSVVSLTTRTPYPLSLTVVPIDRHPRIGRTFRIRAQVSTSPGVAVREVAVHGDPAEADVQLVSTTSPARFATLRGAENVTFAFKAARAGRHRITFSASSDVNTPHTELAVDVLPSDPGLLDLPVVLGAIAALLGFGCIVFAMRRRGGEGADGAG